MCGIMMPPAGWDAHAPASRMTISDAMAHAGAPEETGPEQNAELTPVEFTDWLKRECFTDYIWKSGKGARCTACGADLEPNAFKFSKHNSEEKCPECGKTVILREKRYGHKRLNDEFYAIRWMKSATEQNTLVKIGYFCALDSRGPMPELEEKKIIPILIDVFRYGKGAKRFQRSVWSYGKPMGEAEWYAMREVRAIGVGYFNKCVDVEVYPGSYERAITGTPFAGASECIRGALREKQMQWYRMNGKDASGLIDAIARRPWIEYMIKAGFKNLAIEAMGSMPRGLINPNGKSVRAILKLSTDRYAEMRGKHMDPDINTLQIAQRLDAYGVRVKMDEIELIKRKLGWRSWSEVEQGYGLPDRALVRYILRMSNGQMTTLMDYWCLARQAGIALDTPESKLPRDLDQAHDRALAANNMRRARGNISDEREAELMKKLEARMPELERRYTFAHAGLVLRPARSFAELINEGNALCHCVASYFTSYALGRTDICLLRHADAPNTSWRTIEIDPNSGARRQDRGYKNDRTYMNGRCCGIEPELQAELDAFWEAFDRWREDCMIGDAMKGDEETWKRAG